MAVAELPLPPFPYEKDFFGSPFPKGGKKSALPIFGKKSNKEKSNGRTRKTAMYKAILSLYFLIVFLLTQILAVNLFPKYLLPQNLH